MLGSRSTVLVYLTCIGLGGCVGGCEPAEQQALIVYEGECVDGISKAVFTGDALVPVEGCWTTVSDAAFDPEDIKSLRVGGREDDDNFANRGDVEIHYTVESERIIVQMRPFTFAFDETGALADFERLQPWMYTQSAMAPPFEVDPSRRCVVDGIWQDACNLRVWFDGQVQKLRLGADLRVFVPRGWEGEVTLETQDNVAESEYPNRGNMRVMELPGAADLTLDGGRAEIRLDRSVEPVPACSLAQNQACLEALGDPQSEACQTCTDFGRAHIQTRGGTAANIVVDAPADLWMVASAENTQPGLTEASNPGCSVDIDCSDFESCEWLDKDPTRPWKLRAAINKPALALEGVGYNIKLETAACFATDYVDDPLDYPLPATEVRGSLRVCSGCLEGMISPDPELL